MTIYLSESEMFERYVDGLTKSSSRANEFMITSLNKQPALFTDFIGGIKVAAGSAHQLFHAQENPKWLKIRDILEGVIEVGQNLPVHTENQAHLWKRIKESLDVMILKGSNLFVSKPMVRHEVLLELEKREKSARLDTTNG